MQRTGSAQSTGNAVPIVQYTPFILSTMLIAGHIIAHSVILSIGKAGREKIKIEFSY